MALTKTTPGVRAGDGTAALLDVGTGASQVVQMTTAPAKLPAVDGSNLTGLSTNTLFQAAEVDLLDVNIAAWTGFSVGNTYIKIVAGGVQAGTNGSDPIVQLGDAGGYETSGYEGIVYDDFGATEDLAVTTHIPFTLAGAPSLAVRLNILVIELHKISEVTETWIATTDFWQYSGGGSEHCRGAFTKTLSAEIDRVKLFTDDATTWDAGTAILYRDIE